VSAPEDVRARLRALPAVDRLAAVLTAGAAQDADPAARTTAARAAARSPTPAEAAGAARAVLAARRAELLAGADDDPDLAGRARERLRPSLRRVLNGTGVVVHTNLGRAPLPAPAVAAVREAAEGYVNLELDLTSGGRGSRDAHVRELLVELTGAQDALVVNNGAAAALLAAAALAGPGGAIVVSRGQLVEIGGGFRVPDVIAQAGARLVEVGTTNRTRRADYEAALRDVPDGGRPARPPVELPHRRLRRGGADRGAVRARRAGHRRRRLGRAARGVPALADEPAVRRSVAAGAALTCCSADKLLGGPQAGLLVGTSDAVEACRRHPLARALRVGRLPMAALAATLALHRDPARARAEIPVLAMLDAAPEALRARAERLAAAVDGTLVEVVGRAGGGALPLVDLPGPAVAIGPPGADPQELAAALRRQDPPLLARIADGRVLVDPRTLAEDELDLAVRAIRAALAGAAVPPEA
jgi:L-seryl-tRNA(Ser) seleniumtransferase